MRSWNTLVSFIIGLSLWTTSSFAQNKQYQKPKPAQAATPAASAAPASKDVKAEPAKSDGEKLDISDLEQKYWAPKDTDFSVVQNRTYTKEKRYAFTAGVGPVVNDPYNEGYNYQFQLNYYFDERHGVEFQYIKSDLTDSDATEVFRKSLSGGGVSPDFNRSVEYYAVGYNFVPFYAKMSFLGKKILYLDLQVTPHIGFGTYEQQLQNLPDKEKSAFTFGLDITQYFFVHKDFAVRFNLQNRWSEQQYLKYTDGTKLRDDREHVTMFLMGLTYFFK